MNPDTTYLDRVRSIVEDHLQDEPVDVYLFGSWARGEQSTTSDIDVGAIVHGDVPDLLLSDLREALHDSTIPYTVEVVDLRTASPALRRRVQEEGIPWIQSKNA